MNYEPCLINKKLFVNDFSGVYLQGVFISWHLRQKVKYRRNERCRLRSECGAGR